ncbi:unnamed protein product, partial [Effrenium voratum]
AWARRLRGTPTESRGARLARGSEAAAVESPGGSAWDACWAYRPGRDPQTSPCAHGSTGRMNSRMRRPKRAPRSCRSLRRPSGRSGTTSGSESTGTSPSQ